MQLLQLLGQQLELYINQGQPDLSLLLTRLKTDSLVSKDKYKELNVSFALEAVNHSYAIKKSPANSIISGTGGDTIEIFKPRY
jgi:hypothetical protein